jgi:aryl-alcohol dehydrogenase-like predicted oxidoreductase
LIGACEASLRRLGTDHIDLYQVRCFDGLTPLEETLSALDQLVTSGKVRYIGCSNYSGWQLMKAIGISTLYGWSKYVSHQAFYSLAGRDYEWDLMPFAVDQNIGTIVWSPLGWGRLTGKVRRSQPLAEVSRLHKTREMGPPSRTNEFTQSLRRLMKLLPKPVKLFRRSLSIGSCTDPPLRA